MYYSVRMRSAQGGPHERGGKHISGAEKLTTEAEMEQAALAMIRRALRHPRGKADFINVRIECVPEQMIVTVPALQVSTRAAGCVAEAQQAVLEELAAAGVAQEAAKLGLQQLLLLKESMRGAMLVSAKTGVRLDDNGERGVRVTKMDKGVGAAFETFLVEQGMCNDHAPEALVLASKVASCSGVVAELCWSDDPGYTTGYVASPKRGYCRIPCLKEAGSELGGRIFFLTDTADVSQVCRYLEETPVRVDKGEEA